MSNYAKGVTAVILGCFVLAGILIQQSKVDYPDSVEIEPGTIDTMYQPADTVFVKSVSDSILLEGLLDRTANLEKRVDVLYCAVSKEKNRIVKC